MSWYSARCKIRRDPLLVRSWFKSKIAHIAALFSPWGYALRYLYTISIMINSTCNLKCQHCDIGQGKYDYEYYKNTAGNGEMPVDVFHNVVNDIKQYAPFLDRLRLNGVEPLLHTNFNEIIRVLCESKIPYYISTNGYLLEQYAEALVNAEPYYINVSIDGPQEIHDTIRGVPGSFQKAYDGIKALVRIKKQRRKPYPKVWIHYTISALNAHCLTNTIDCLSDCMVDGFKFTHLNYISHEMAEAFNNRFYGKYNVAPSSANGIALHEVNENVLYQQIEKVKKKTPYAFFSMNLSSPNAILNYYKTSKQVVMKSRCMNPWLHAQILANGDVVPEARCFHPRLGNINESPFSRIWNNEQYRIFRTDIARNGITPICSRCFGLLR